MKESINLNHIQSPFVKYQPSKHENYITINITILYTKNIFSTRQEDGQENYK